MAVVSRRLDFWTRIYFALFFSQTLGRLVLTSVEPLGNRTTLLKTTKVFSVAADAETLISVPIIEPHPIAPILEPGVNPPGLHTHEAPFWRNEANSLNTVASQTSRGRTESYKLLLQSRNVTTNRNIQPENSHVNLSIKRSIIKPRAAIKNGVTLRILVLGASIASGEGSSDLNGFRYGLRNALVAGGNPVNMVGSMDKGTMGDNQVEGWPGAIISELHPKAALTLPKRPNVVIIQCGSNDLSRNIDPPGAATRMGVVVDQIFAAVPETLILISGLMPMSSSASEALSTGIYNPGLRQMVTKKSEEGKNIWFIDMHDGYINLDDLRDGLHPHDGGYLKMARLYYDTLVGLGSAINPPQAVAGVDDAAAQLEQGSDGIDTKCQKVPVNSIGQIQTQQRSGENDDPYIHKNVDRWQFARWEDIDPAFPPVAAGIFWADLTGNGYDDMIYVEKNFKFIQVSINIGVKDGMVQFVPGPMSVATGIDCPLAGVQFADSNSNGIDDLFCVSANGDLKIFVTRPSSASPFQASWVGTGNVDLAGIAGYPRARVRIGDIDGDGRADYLVLHDNGDVEAWRNCGAVHHVEYWQYLGIVSSGKSFGDLTGIRFVDINGDGRDDLLWISDKGSVTTWINHRNLSPGSIVPKWMPPLLTHGGPGIVGVRGRTSFGKMYSPSTRNQNYIVNTVDGANPGIMLYENQDNGGKFSNGDGVYNCEHVPSLSALPAGPVRALEWPFPREPTFFAIGDSYSAAPGAGDRIQDAYDLQNNCYKGSNSFALQFARNYFYNYTAEFPACTGAISSDVIGPNNSSDQREPQLRQMRRIAGDTGGWATLTIGGNDVWLSNVVKKCFFTPTFYNYCESQLAKTEARVQSQEFEQQMMKTYWKILEQSHIPGFTLVVIDYPQFFNALDTRCNDKSFLTVIGAGEPKLTVKIRTRINAVIDAMNYRIASFVALTQFRLDNAGIRKRIRLHKIDDFYDYNRYCDFVTKEGKDRDWKDDAWFSTLFGSDKDGDGNIIPRAQEVGPGINVRNLDPAACEAALKLAEATGGDFDLACYYRLVLVDHPTFDLAPPHSLSDFNRDTFKNDFYPKSIAHHKVAESLYMKWHHVWGPQYEE